MIYIEDILSRRQADERYDQELWSFVDDRQGARLSHLEVEQLQARLELLDKNIQYLDVGNPCRDKLAPERGWVSPWWWLRLRHWAMREFERRGLSPEQTSALPKMPTLDPACQGVIAGGKKLLVRISRREWLLDALCNGAVRFTPATLYGNLVGDAARADDELRKSYRRGGSSVTITKLDGTPIKPIGEVTFSTVRALERDNQLVDFPYWLCSYSSDLDPRLFAEFTCGNLDEDACLIIFDPMEFIKRLRQPSIAAAPLTVKRLFPIDYFDPYYPPVEPLSPLSFKDVQFAYQREMRLVLDPEGGPPLAGGGPLTLNIGSIADIAAVYAADGRRIEGSGPDNFMR